MVFDYYVDDKTGAMVPWATKVPAFVYDPSDFANLFVPTVETTRLTYLLNLLVANRHHVMLVGSTGALLPDFLKCKLVTPTSQDLAPATATKIWAGNLCFLPQ